MTSRSATYTTVSWIVLIDSGLSHGRGVDWELGLVQELSQFLLDTMADSASINEDGNVTVSLLDQLVNVLDDGSLDIWVILRWLPVEGGGQSRGRDPLIRYVGGKGKVHRPSLYKSGPMSGNASGDKGMTTYASHTVGQHTVNFNIGVLLSGEVSLGDGELFGGFLVRVKPAYVESARRARVRAGCGWMENLRTFHRQGCGAT